MMDTPGPGHYETNQSSLVSTEFTRKMLHNLSKARLKDSTQKSLDTSLALISSKNMISNANLGFGSSAGKVGNPGASVDLGISRFSKGGIPSIPSRFLTPVLKFDKHSNDQSYQYFDTVIGKNQDNQNEIVVAKIAKLEATGQQLGPGSYDPNKKDKMRSPDMAIDRTRRLNNFEKNMTETRVGPGSYGIYSEVERPIKNQTIARAHPMFRTLNVTKKRIKNKGSIRADYEEGNTTSEEETEPGPGKYLKNYHISKLGQQPILHDHPQQFGVLESRFKEFRNQLKHGNQGGPGQYLSQDLIEKFQPKKGVEGTSNFKGAGRIITRNEDPLPGPGSYLKDLPINKNREPGNEHPFAFNEKRFITEDREVPGPGAYKQPDSVKVHLPNKQFSVFKSTATKETEIVIGRDNPGTGEYDNYHQNTIANKDFQGGSANNFVMFTKNNYKLK
jgi:hypothetical protein